MARFDDVVDTAGKHGRSSARKQRKSSVGQDFGLLVLRIFSGGIMAGHGAQKLFGKFGGAGLDGTAGWLESLGLRPGKFWATMAGASEFGGGGLTSLGFLHPLGPIATMSSMAMGTAKVHWGKPIWAADGGPELPLLNLVVGLALIFTGPGRFSLDRIFHVRVSRGLVFLTIIGAAASVAYGIKSSQPETLPNANDQGTKSSVERERNTL